MAGLGGAAIQRLRADDAVRVGIIGSGGRGRYLMGEFKEIGAHVDAVCDVYEPNRNAGLKIASTGARPYTDYHRLLEDKSIDAVIIATPDHWHARMLIDAVEAGKDAYVEKPLAHTIEDGFEMVRAVRRTKRVVQVGTQRRSSEFFLRAKQIMDSGSLGEVRLVTATWMNRQDGLSSASLKGPLDWPQWLGSAPQRPLEPVRFFNWLHFWDYSGGYLVGQAAHIMDAIQWFMNSKEPVAVTCSGGRVNLPGAEVPETASLVVEYPENYLASFTIGYSAMRYNMFNDQIKQFHGSKARFDVGREWYSLFPQSDAVDMKPSVTDKQPGSFAPATRAHIRNFLECVRTRRDPNATIEIGQSTNIVLCMAMQSLREGRTLRWNSASQRVEA
jgi:predicted dehydrogenase